MMTGRELGLPARDRLMVVHDPADLAQIVTLRHAVAG